MKDRKTLSHSDLMAQLLLKVNFPLDTSMVNKRIDTLIEKDYIKRNAQDASIYEYLA
jgi:cullin-4